jgi:hypothetical protein
MRSLHNYHQVWKQYGFTPEFYNIPQVTFFNWLCELRFTIFNFRVKPGPIVNHTPCGLNLSSQ